LYKEYSKIPTNISGLKRMIEFDKKFYLSDDILCKVDRSSMFNSLETRAPYLNKEVHSFSKKIPDKFLIHKQKGKIILRNILKKYIPEDLINRPKMGFSIPLDEFLRNSLKQWAGDIINSDLTKNNEIINYKSLKLMWDEHIVLKKDWHKKIWPKTKIFIEIMLKMCVKKEFTVLVLLLVLNRKALIKNIFARNTQKELFPF